MDNTDNTDDTDDEYAFYANKIEDKDDYIANTYKGKLLKTKVSLIIDVVLSVLLMFYWMLWLVRTIFSNWIQDLCRNEGVVVKVDVLESCTVNNEGTSTVDWIEGMEANITFDTMNLPTCTVILSYVASARIARNGKFIGTLSIDNTHVIGNVQSKTEKLSDHPNLQSHTQCQHHPKRHLQLHQIRNPTLIQTRHHKTPAPPH